MWSRGLRFDACDFCVNGSDPVRESPQLVATTLLQQGGTSAFALSRNRLALAERLHVDFDDVDRPGREYPIELGVDGRNAIGEPSRLAARSLIQKRIPLRCSFQPRSVPLLELLLDHAGTGSRYSRLPNAGQ